MSRDAIFFYDVVGFNADAQYSLIITPPNRQKNKKDRNEQATILSILLVRFQGNTRDSLELFVTR